MTRSQQTTYLGGKYYLPESEGGRPALLTFPILTWFLVTLQLANSTLMSSYQQLPFSSSLLLLGQQNLPPRRSVQNLPTPSRASSGCLPFLLEVISEQHPQPPKKACAQSVFPEHLPALSLHRHLPFSSGKTELPPGTSVLYS